ncbi:MAG: hypothetical protein IH853_05530 [Bacteroidetes bacterium]|nr:hypothetical protein [Bacteroidota bacterium]MCH8246168.1 hypothetical protein [Bacteroidota bacterium]
MKACRKYVIGVLLVLLGFVGGIPGGFLGAKDVSAQDNRRLLRTWMQGQRSAVEKIGSLRVVESVEQVMDSGFGKQELRFEAVRELGPDAQSPGRTISRIRFNGREVPVDRGERVRRRFRSMLRPEMARLLDAYRFPVREIARMVPSRSITQEALDGTPMWRVDSVPRNQGGPIERLTAWFDQDDFRLQASQTVLSLPRGNSLRIRTAYDRFDGIDLPVHRQVEGSTPVRRRMRLFTMLFEQRVEYSDYEITRKD